MLWQPQWSWLTEPCESVWSDFSDAGYSQPKQGKEGWGEGGREGEGERNRVNETKLFGSTGFIYPCTFLTYPHTASAGADRREEEADVLTGYVLTVL